MDKDKEIKQDDPFDLLHQDTQNNPHNWSGTDNTNTMEEHLTDDHLQEAFFGGNNPQNDDKDHHLEENLGVDSHPISDTAHDKSHDDDAFLHLNNSDDSFFSAWTVALKDLGKENVGFMDWASDTFENNPNVKTNTNTQNTSNTTTQNPNQLGTQNQFNNPNQLGTQNQFNNPNQLGTQNQFNNPNQLGTQNQLNNPNQSINQNTTVGNQNPLASSTFGQTNTGFGNNFNNQNRPFNQQGFNQNQQGFNQNQQGFNQNQQGFNQNQQGFNPNQGQNNYIDNLNKLQAGQNFTKNFQNYANTLQGEGMPSSSSELFEKYDVSIIEVLNDKLFKPNAERKKVSDEERTEVRDKLILLKGRIVKDREKYRAYEKKSKNWAFTFKLLQSFLSAFVTVLLGISVTDYMKSFYVDWYINTSALFISAFVSVITVIQGFFDANELYIKYTDTANRLDEYLGHIEYLETGTDYLDINMVNAIFIEYTRLIENTHKYEAMIRGDSQQPQNNK